MIRTLEIAWLLITIISLVIAAYKFYSDGFQDGLWMLMVAGISVIMYVIRRRQRIRYERKDEKELYH
ncbi:MAG: hypothetical protein U0X76_04250 [Bacteroidia bacterium]